MSNSELATLSDVRRTLLKAQDGITVVSTVSALLPRDAYHTDYDDEWQQSFNEKANALVGVIAEELGDGWTNLPLDTQLGSKGQEAFRAVHALVENEKKGIAR